MLAPIMVAPSLLVVAAATAVFAGWTAVGLVNPGMVNAMGCVAANKLAAVAPKDTVKMYEEPDPKFSAAVPVGLPPDGEVNVRAAVPELASAMPAPNNVITILPLLGTVVTGVSVMLMVTDPAPLATLLRAMAGDVAPSASTIAG